MVKGCKEFISEQVRKQKGTFENDWGNQIAEFGVYGKTVHTFVYTADTKKRYVHIYYSAAKAAGGTGKIGRKYSGNAELSEKIPRYRARIRVIIP